MTGSMIRGPGTTGTRRSGKMFVYQKKLQYPVKIDRVDPKLASIIISQYGGPYSNRLQYKVFHFLCNVL